MSRFFLASGRNRARSTALTATTLALTAVSTVWLPAAAAPAVAANSYLAAEPSTQKSAEKSTEKSAAKTASKESESSSSKSTESTTNPPKSAKADTKRSDKSPTSGNGDPISKWGEGVAKRMTEATEKAEDDGSTIGLAILDRTTGEFICNAYCDEPFQLASLSKVFIAESVGYANFQPPAKGSINKGNGETPADANADSMLRDDMMRYSDNEATESLWNRFGATAIVEDSKERYHLSDETVPNSDWGSTKSSPRDMVTLLNGIVTKSGGLSDSESDYLVRLMYSLPHYSYGNADQRFGIQAALPNEMVGQKGGWFDPLTRTSAGYIGDESRYVMAALGKDISGDALTDAVKTVFPNGVVNPDEKKDGVTDAAANVSLSNHVQSSGVNPAWLLAAATAGFILGWLVFAFTRNDKR